MNNIILRKQAKAQKLKHYFTGKPCKYGHNTKRLVSDCGCMECSRLKSNRNWKENPEKMKELSKKTYQTHKAKYRIKRLQDYRINPEKYRIPSRNWKSRNKAKHNEYACKYDKSTRKININYKLKTNLRSCLNTAIKNNQKSGSAVKDLGCSIPEFKTYIESKFKPGMSWDNWGKKGWHIDHIKPLSAFDLNNNKEQLLKACHCTNLQPLWARENLVKSNGY